ncbi:hypothetical protein P8452_42856 [Trifolium repens]|nr:hypothetical protein P8452_42856 [Trifolium repens]
MVHFKKPYFSSPLSSYVHFFLDGGKISKLTDLISLEEKTIAYVVCCFYGIVEGIDTVLDDDIKSEPRYRLKIKVSNELDPIEFLMYDSIVKKFAPLTYTQLEEEKTSSNVYPHEVEELIGDPILFKVRKECACDSSGGISVEVLDFIIDSSVMEIYLNPSHDAYCHNANRDDSIISPAVDDQDLNSLPSETTVVDLIVPSFQSNCLALNEFIGNVEVKRLGDLCDSKNGSTCIVIGWYDSVSEGVNMWYPDDDYCNEPRFRLKINVRDEGNEFTLVLFDEQAETSSVYPHEMDTIYGDAILFKVTKKDAESFNVDPSYEVVDMLADPLILDKFFEHYMPGYGTIDLVAIKLSPVEVCDASSSSEYEIVTPDSCNFDTKRKLDIVSQQVDSKISSKRSKKM